MQEKIGVSEVKKDNKSKKIQLLIADIKSDNTVKIEKSLEALQSIGNYSIIEPLFEFIMQSENQEGKSLVLEFLCSLKDTKSSLMVMDCLSQEKFKSIKIEILSTIWNAKVDYSDYLSDFVQFAVKDDFLVTLECLTIIENLEGPFQENQLLESQLYLKEYAESKNLQTAEKDQLISEIAILLKEFDLNTED